MRELTTDELRQFATDGFLVVRDVVPEHLLAPVDDEINALIESTPPRGDVRGSHQIAAPTPPELPACDAAWRESGAHALAESLVAPHTLHHILDHIQVVVNVPPTDHVPGGPHLDCHGGEGDPLSFTLLGGMFLGDEMQPHQGNLWVWPGSHLTHQQLFHDRGPHALVSNFGHITGLDDPPPFPPRPQESVLAKRGDVLLAHFLLGHNHGGNRTDQMRRMVYFRLGADGHRERWQETFLDAFTEFAPVRAALLT